MTFDRTIRIPWPVIFTMRLMLLGVLLVLAAARSARAQDDFDFSNRSLFVDTSNVGSFQCGQFYVLNVYEAYFVEAGGPPKYRLYGELILYKPCLAPLPPPERGDFPVEVVQAINCIKKCPEGPCGCDIGFTKAPFSLLRIPGESIPAPKILGGATLLPASIFSPSGSKSYQVMVRQLDTGGANPVDADILAKYPEYSQIFAPPFRFPNDRKTKYLFLLGARTGTPFGALDLIVDPLSEIADCAQLRDLIDKPRALPGAR